MFNNSTQPDIVSLISLCIVKPLILDSMSLYMWEYDTDVWWQLTKTY